MTIMVSLCWKRRNCQRLLERIKCVWSSSLESTALEVSCVNLRNDKEIFQESLEANVWSVTKARKSFDGHVFVVRDTETKQWLTSYKNNPSHTNVFITLTPFGVCVNYSKFISKGMTYDGYDV